MAGGTGGHVFPALAVAAELQQRGHDVEWLGTRRGIEATLVPEAGIPLHIIAIEGLRGKSKVTLLKAPWLLLQAVLQALAVLRRVRPDVVLGLGGFASGPGGVAAKLLGKPLVIHEQNAVAGTTNRILAKIARRIVVAFPQSLPGSTLVGNPVRREISALPPPRERYSRRKGKIHLLVLGGSLGAQAINRMLPEALTAMDADTRPEIWHQTGPAHFDQTRELYSRHTLDAKVEPFIKDMASALGWADLVVARSGALTVSELTAAGVAAVLVPFPYAIDDHQTQNAQWLVQHDAAVLKAQSELTPASVKQLLQALMRDRSRLCDMACRARTLALPEAANQVANICQEVVCG